MTAINEVAVINRALFRVVVLWLHAGIGPLLGAGPMEACRNRHKCARKSASAGTTVRRAGNM